MPEKKWLALSVQRIVKKIVSHTIRHTPYAIRSQSGAGQLILVMLLLAGVAVGTYVVQNRTNLIPHADDGVKAGYCESNFVFNGGDAGDDASWSPISESSCDEYYHEHSDDNSYLCGKAGGSWRDGRCYTGGSSETNSNDAPQENQSDKDDSQSNKSCEGNGYVFKYSECTNNKPGEVRDVCQNSKGDYKTANVHTQSGVCGDSNNGGEPDQRNDSGSSQGGQNNPGNDSSSNKNSGNSQYDQGDCRDGAQVYKDGYTWIAYCNQVCSKNSDCAPNKSDGAVNPDTSNWCYGFNNGQAPRCMKLVQSDNKEVTDSKRKEDNSKAVSEIKSNLSSGNNPDRNSSQSGQPATPMQSASVDLKAKIASQIQQRSDLLGNLATALNNAGTNSTLKAEITRAQTLLNDASSRSTTCYTGNDKPLSDACDGQAQAANDIAVAASRVAMFDSIMAGGTGCVKVDMAVGSNTSNSKIEVKSIGSDDPSRLFMCRGKDGVIQWRVREDENKGQDVSQASLNELGLRTGQKDANNAVPQDFINRRNAAAELASQPKYSSSTAEQTWQEVAVSNCLNNCSSFPNGATCYQKGNQYNCNGSKPNSSTSPSSTPNASSNKQDKNGKCESNNDCKSNRCNTGTNRCI